MAKVYSKTLHSEDIFKKVNSDYEKDGMLLAVDIQLSIQETSILFLNKLFQQKIHMDPTFKSYVTVVLEQNMKEWEIDNSSKKTIDDFRIAKHFVKDKDILKILHEFEESIAKK